MRETYQVCVKCKNLMPLLTYFLSKEENDSLSPYEKRMCFDCYMKRKNPGYRKKIEARKEQMRLKF